MKYYELNYDDETYNVRIERNKYLNDTLAISLISDDGEPFADLTVNLMDSFAFCDDKTAFVDTNNCPWAEEFIKQNNLGTFMNQYGHSGFCRYPLYRFNVEEM